MSHNRVTFDRQMRKLDRKHDAMARGYSTVMLPDGLIVIKPNRRRVRLPLHLIVYTVAALFMFKAFLLANLGADPYQERLDSLANGTDFEKAGAWIMQADPATRYLAEQATAIFN